MKKRPHLRGPHNVVLLAYRGGMDEVGVYAEFLQPPAGLEFVSPTGMVFTTNGADLKVYLEQRAPA